MLDLSVTFPHRQRELEGKVVPEKSVREREKKKLFFFTLISLSGWNFCARQQAIDCIQMTFQLATCLLLPTAKVCFPDAIPRNAKLLEWEGPPPSPQSGKCLQKVRKRTPEASAEK